MKNKSLPYVLVAIGGVSIGAGLCMLRTAQSGLGVLRSLPYVLIGLGCGSFGHGTGELIGRLALKNSPDVARKAEIEKNDERYIAVASRAKAKAFDIMIFVFGALMLAFALMGVDLAATLLLVAAYLFVVGCGIYYRCKYDKEM
jgi:hypothetical protein